MFLNLLIDFIPRNIGINTAWKWAKNRIGKNKIILYLNQNQFKLKIYYLNYLKSEIYHCKTTMISIVRTKGNAGYLVWKSAGGQGDHDISLPLGSFEKFKFFFFFWSVVSVANPLLIFKAKFHFNEKQKKLLLGFSYFFIWVSLLWRGWILT